MLPFVKDLFLKNLQLKHKNFDKFYHTFINLSCYFLFVFLVNGFFTQNKVLQLPKNKVNHIDFLIYNNPKNIYEQNMGNRLSKIYTRTGDDGKTGLADGARLPKDDLRFDTMGMIDQLNAQIGLVIAYTNNADITNKLLIIQHLLFNIGGEIALPNHQKIGYIAIQDKHISQLENWIDDHNAYLPPLKDFILPSGSVVIANTHIARTLCRHSERLLIGLHTRDNNISKNTRIFINRLSDFLFVLARFFAYLNNEPEVLWQKELTQ